MIIHHIRNATMVIETKDKVLLIDPMLGKKGASSAPFTIFRFKPRRNPILDLPEQAMALIQKTTHCILTHLHPDHLDKDAEHFLTSQNIPVICSKNDEAELQKRGLNIFKTIDYWTPSEFMGGTLEGIPARHGYGYVAKPMGHVMGYFLKLPDEPSIYLSSDTIYTDDVEKVLHNYDPDFSVVACGTAQLDLFKPLLMTMDDIVRFVSNAPGKVIANHLEAVNHCPTTRSQLRITLKAHNLLEKTYIPEDGEAIQTH